MIDEIRSGDAPNPHGHYSQAVKYNGLLYTSMQLPVNPHTGIIAVSIDDQAHQLFSNCAAILRAGGSSYSNVVSATIYLVNLCDWAQLDKSFAVQFGQHKPARAMVQVGELHLGAKVGLQLIAMTS